jgi:tripartite-type tricarboxylate transporter receptor subunit TctC
MMPRCGVSAWPCALLLLSLPAVAQNCPDRTVRIIVPTAPGGSIETTARVLAAKLSDRWGKPVIIENRPGASIKLALATPDVRDRLENLGMDIRTGAAEELQKKLTADIQKWPRLVKEKNIQIAP